MLCMKCGREIEGEDVFCPACLAEMEKYPVKPGTVVQLPRRDTSPKRPAAYRAPVVPLEEQVKKLKKRVARLTVALLLALAAVVGLAAVVVYQNFEEVDKFLPGQNYSSVSSTSAAR